MSAVSDTSNIPPSDVGSYLGLQGFYWLSGGDPGESTAAPMGNRRLWVAAVSCHGMLVSKFYYVPQPNLSDMIERDASYPTPPRLILYYMGTCISYLVISGPCRLT